MRDLRLLEVLDETFRKKYQATEKLEPVGHSLSGVNAILNYKDGDMQISIKVSKQACLRVYFEYEKSKDKLQLVDFEKFEEKYKEGVSLEEIEEKIKKEQLPLNEETKNKTKNKGEKNGKN